MSLSQETLAIYQSRLADAELAYHRLQIGESAVMVRDQSGDEVRYTAANVSRLRSYISELKVIIASGNFDTSGPIRVVFG